MVNKQRRSKTWVDSFEHFPEVFCIIFVKGVVKKIIANS